MSSSVCNKIQVSVGRKKKTRYHATFSSAALGFEIPRHHSLSQPSAPLSVYPRLRHAPHVGATQTIFAFRYQDCKKTPLNAALDWPYRRRRHSQSARETFNSLTGFISKGPDEGEHELIDHCFPGKGHA